MSFSEFLKEVVGRAEGFFLIILASDEIPAHENVFRLKDRAGV